MQFNRYYCLISKSQILFILNKILYPSKNFTVNNNVLSFVVFSIISQFCRNRENSNHGHYIKRLLKFLLFFYTFLCKLSKKIQIKSQGLFLRCVTPN